MNKLSIEPRVRNLTSYLDDIENGLLQIPSFQRDFVWTRDKIKELFDSIKNRYPIGSVLLWKPGQQIGDDKKTIGSYYTPKEKKEKVYYISPMVTFMMVIGMKIILMVLEHIYMQIQEVK